MTDHDPARSGSADAARARMAAGLRATGRAISPAIQEAFARVPRHVFVPEMGQAAAYRDEAFVLKIGSDGIPVSSSSQPAMMAIMLEQLGLQPGHRVLEIGTGSGYNAALMSMITGPRGKVVSVDIDAELVARARASLAAAGYPKVEVRCADGGYGDPAGAPFDRIMVTAGAWDIAPAWLEQLSEGGRLVLPLSVRGIELSVALDRSANRWASTSACRCGFVRMLGAFAQPESAVRLPGTDGVVVQVADGHEVDAAALRLALSGPAIEMPLRVRVTDQGDLGDLDLWLTLTDPHLERLTVLSASRTQFLLPLGGLASDALDPARVGVAALVPDGHELDLMAGVTVHGFGPGGEALARHLAARAASWTGLGRPGAVAVQLSVWPAGTDVQPGRGMVMMERPHARIAVGWPEAS
jgi:protein-L-isoaspartate(D-aspartate) O-methyltransferase